MHDCGVGIYIIEDTNIKSFDRAWTWHVILVSNDLMDTDFALAPWGLSKAHIFVSTPARWWWWSFASNPSTLERTMRGQPGLVFQHSTWLWRTAFNRPKQAAGTMRKKTTWHFLCTQNLAKTFSSWFHSHFLLTLVQLSPYSSHGQNFDKWVGTSPAKTPPKGNRCQWGQQSEATSRDDAKELRNAKSRCFKTTLHFLCTQILAQAFPWRFHSHFLLTLVQLSSYWRHGQKLRQVSRDITSQNSSERKSVSMRTTVQRSQMERCERTAQPEVSLLESNLEIFVHSKPCANFFLLISFTISTHTGTTLTIDPECWGLKLETFLTMLDPPSRSPQKPV